MVFTFLTKIPSRYYLSCFSLRHCCGVFGSFFFFSPWCWRFFLLPVFFCVGASAGGRTLERGEDQAAAGAEGLFVGEPPARWKPGAERDNFPHAQGHERGRLVSWSGVFVFVSMGFVVVAMSRWCAYRILY